MKSDASFQLDGAAWPAFVVEAGGTLRQANQAAIDFFGPKLEGEGLSLSALWAGEAETAEQFLARWERSATSVIPLRFHGKGGAVVTFATYVCAVRDTQKRYIFQLLRAQDIGSAPLNDLTKIGIPEARSSGGDTVFFQKQKLDCALQLTRTVALDFNNVLTGILGHASLILTQMEMSAPFRPSLLEIEKAAEKAAEIAQHLAAFSRPEKETAGHTSGNLNSVIRRVVETFQKAKPSGIRWELQLQDHLYSVKFDEAKVQQAIVKIVENAVEALGERGGRVALACRNLDITEPTRDRTARLPAGTYVSIEITDDGKGIDAEALPRIFEPFFSTKHGHRGLGLAWVYGIITNHRGGVAVSSEPQRGTSVRLYLPSSQRIVTDTALLSSMTGRRRTVLIVDDEELLLTMGQTVLSSFGFEVLMANSGESALEAIDHSKLPIDLIITDLVMPKMSGRELIEQIQLRLPDVPILRTSGYVRAPGEEEQDTYLQKPFTSQMLLRRVKSLLQEDDDAESETLQP
jgi:signal transduction histidine kinase/ActR/RegA family two-component response regulator